MRAKMPVLSVAGVLRSRITDRIHSCVIIPFFMINLVAGLTPISLWTYGWTTAIGITPGSFVFAFAGQQLGNISSARDVFTIQIMIAFALLALLALVPTIIKYVQKPKQ